MQGSQGWRGAVRALTAFADGVADSALARRKRAALIDKSGALGGARERRTEQQDDQRQAASDRHQKSSGCHHCSTALSQTDHRDDASLVSPIARIRPTIIENRLATRT